MVQLEPRFTLKSSFKSALPAALLALLFPLSLFAQGYDDSFEMKNKIKIELQYADYSEYEYPEPIVFEYGVRDYQQTLPFIVNFPEKRGLVKFTRLAGSSTALSFKYQFSEMREDVSQHMGEFKVTRSLSDAFVGLVAMQVIRDTREYNAYQPGLGFQWTVSPLTIFQGDVQYFWRGKDAEPVGGRMGSLNVRLKYRQVLTVSTAMLLEYILYEASGETIDFTSHVVSVWLSQFLPTQTALHANLRWYDNNMGIRSLAPSLEIAQYLDWATVLRVKYRYYTNRSENVSLGETDVIIPDDLKSHTVSVQLNREINPDLQIYGKYRLYKSNLSVQMNTYLFGFVYSF